MGFTPSPYQKAVFTNVRDTDDSLIVEAVAGSGKTTTIVSAVKLIPESLTTMFCAFNKSIANELTEKLPDHVNCCTLNSLGHRAWMRYVGGRIQLKTTKTYDILDSPAILGLYEKKDVRSVRYIVNQLVSFAKQAGMVPEGVDGLNGLIPDTDKNWTDIINHYHIDMGVKRDGKTGFEIREETNRKTKLAIELARKVLTISVKQTKIIDFNDQLFLPVVYGANFPKNDVIFVDEAQDISHIQRVMLRRALKSNGRIIAVGDPCQAIYGFRGADSESLNNIGSEFGAKRLPLSISYRCAKEVVKEAQKYVEHIEAFEDAPEGKVEQLGTFGPNNMDMFQPEDFVLCRNVAPLVKLAFALITEKKPVTILGKNIGKSISNLIDKLGAKDVDDLRTKLMKWEKDETTRLLERDPEASCEFIEQQADSVRTFINCSGENTIEGIQNAIERLFSDNAKGAVKLSTVHKSKGLEAERVIILDQHLMPSKYAVKPWQLEQENNLMYVAITRSINYLGYIESPDAKKPREEY